jgi:hypothetical protein
MLRRPPRAVQSAPRNEVSMARRVGPGLTSVHSPFMVCVWLPRPFRLDANRASHAKAGYQVPSGSRRLELRVKSANPMGAAELRRPHRRGQSSRRTIVHSARSRRARFTLGRRPDRLDWAGTAAFSHRRDARRGLLSRRFNELPPPQARLREGQALRHCRYHFRQCGLQVES